MQLLNEVKASRPPRLRLRPANGGALTTLSWQPKKANEVWTQQEFTALCEHLHNDNDSTRYVMGMRLDTGEKKYAKANRLKVERAISWAWASIARPPKRKLAFVPYSTNEHQQSRWGGMDFDAHDDNADRARELAFGAFRCLINTPDLCVILETSGSGGWHVWAISPDFHATQEWTRLLKSVAQTIGVAISAGCCEIFPPDSKITRFGKGMRAPGCWNPRTDTLSEIVWQNASTSLGEVLSGKSKNRPLNSNALRDHFPDTEKEIVSLDTQPHVNLVNSDAPLALYREADFLRRFGITAPRTRNDKLSSLVGDVFHQLGMTSARRLVELQFQSKSVVTEATLSQHMESFAKLCAGLVESWLATLLPEERKAFDGLSTDTDNQHDAFRIIRSFARKAAMDGAKDFPIARDNLALRLGMTGKGAAWIRDKFAELGIIARTCDYRPNKSAARYKWLLVLQPSDRRNDV